MKLDYVSPLSSLSPLAEPDCNLLLTSIKEALNRSQSVSLWSRMEQNHYARYCWWPGQHPSCVRRWCQEAGRPCRGPTARTCA